MGSREVSGRCRWGDWDWGSLGDWGDPGGHPGGSRSGIPVIPKDPSLPPRELGGRGVGESLTPCAPLPPDPAPTSLGIRSSGKSAINPMWKEGKRFKSGFWKGEWTPAPRPFSFLPFPPSLTDFLPFSRFPCPVPIVSPDPAFPSLPLPGFPAPPSPF